ncbi:hypothetical protein HON01_00125 [Candidatus Woesearchaeota archaeon]|jgi:hypothetical protein|nr:hypothetical protein [Candidatus Woesearchaeota archaeon]MBT7367434.1 hypothetical protein [Candidatus Woesearchaeota archaeon]
MKCEIKLILYKGIITEVKQNKECKDQKQLNYLSNIIRNRGKQKIELEDDYKSHYTRNTTYN